MAKNKNTQQVLFRVSESVLTEFNRLVETGYGKRGEACTEAIQLWLTCKKLEQAIGSVEQ